MADDKDKKDGEEGTKGGGGLMPLILVAVGAILGGAGAVFLTGPGKAETHVIKTLYVSHPDVINLTFHPRPEREGAAPSTQVCVIEMTFQYKTTAYGQEDHGGGDHGGGGHGGGGGGGPKMPKDEEKFLKTMKNRWRRMEAELLSRLSRMTARELQREPARVEKEITEGIQEALFPPTDNYKDVPGQPIAEVTDVYITKLLIQK